MSSEKFADLPEKTVTTEELTRYGARYLVRRFVLWILFCFAYGIPLGYLAAFLIEKAPVLGWPAVVLAVLWYWWRVFTRAVMDGVRMVDPHV
jgi:hypothetical protein